MLSTAKQHETLLLASNIVSGKTDVGVVENSLTLSQTINLPALRSVFKAETAQIAFGVGRIIVDRFLSSFGFSTKHNPAQVDIITADVLDAFKYESMQDVILFLKMARTGRFGATNRGIDSNLILGDWMPMYLEAKAEEREKQHTKEKQDRIRLEISPEALLRQHQKDIAPMKRKKEEQAFRDYVERMTKGIDRYQLESLIKQVSKVTDVLPYINILKCKRLEITFKCHVCFQKDTMSNILIEYKDLHYCRECFEEIKK